MEGMHVYSLGTVEHVIPYWRVIRRMRLYFHRKEICAYT